MNTNEDDTYNSLVNFIKRFLLEEKIRPTVTDFNRATSVEDDLGITGDDADPFLTRLVEKYGLDYSEFHGAQYFGGENEDADFIFPILRLFFGQRKWMPLPKHKRKSMTIGMLEECIKNKKLV